MQLDLSVNEARVLLRLIRTKADSHTRSGITLQHIGEELRRKITPSGMKLDETLAEWLSRD